MPAGARFTGFCIGMLHLRILRDCFLLLFPAAVNLNVLPGNIACVVTRKKAYQVCVFHIAACSSYKGKLARLGIAYVIVIRGAYTSRRNAVYQYSLIRYLFGKRPCERNKRCFTLEIYNLPFLINIYRLTVNHLTYVFAAVKNILCRLCLGYRQYLIDSGAHFSR